MDWKAYLCALLLMMDPTGVTGRTVTMTTNYDIAPHEPYSYYYFEHDKDPWKRHYLDPNRKNRRQLQLEQKCDGEENLKHDIGVISFKLSLISSVAGLISLTELSFPSNNITIISTILSLILWVPSGVLTFLAWSDPISWTTGNLVNLMSLIVTLYGGVGFITGTADIFVSIVDEVLGLTAIILSSVTTFPEMYDELKVFLQDALGKERVDNWINGYGCGHASNWDLIRELIVS